MLSRGVLSRVVLRCVVRCWVKLCSCGLSWSKLGSAGLRLATSCEYMLSRVKLYPGVLDCVTV